jgi:hypothetical protein
LLLLLFDPVPVEVVFGRAPVGVAGGGNLEAGVETPDPALVFNPPGVLLILLFNPARLLLLFNAGDGFEVTVEALFGPFPKRPVEFDPGSRFIKKSGFFCASVFFFKGTLIF